MAVLAPSSSGLGRRPLKAVARVRIPSGLQRSAVRGHHDAGRFRFRRRSSRAAVASLTGLGVFHTLGQSLPASAGLLAPCPCGPPPGRCLRAGRPGAACVPAVRAPPACRLSGLRLLGGLPGSACVPAFGAPPARRPSGLRLLGGLPGPACVPAFPGSACSAAFRPRLLASHPTSSACQPSGPHLPGDFQTRSAWRPSGPGLRGGLRARLLAAFRIQPAWRPSARSAFRPLGRRLLAAFGQAPPSLDCFCMTGRRGRVVAASAHWAPRRTIAQAQARARDQAAIASGLPRQRRLPGPAAAPNQLACRDTRAGVPTPAWVSR